MHLPNTPAWSLTCAFPEELQFGAYVGQHEGFRVDESLPAASVAEADWRAWWQLLPTNTLTYCSSEANRDRHTPTTEFLRRDDPRDRSGFDPPSFGRLVGRPALQQLCQFHWPAFHRDWGMVGGRKMSLVSQQTAQFGRVRVDKLVRESVRAAHKPASRPFYLRVDFVIWPEDYRRDISDHHLVLGVQYLDPSRITVLLTTLNTYIARLV